jgi:hypothetical protein
MQRRKFIAGLGSLAAAGAATIGTGAFTSVEADRGIAVDVASDADAFLALRADGTANGAEYVESTGNGTVTLDFTEADRGDSGGGAGVNANATTVFDELLNIENQGSQTVIVGHRQDFPPQKGALFHEDYEDGAITRVGDVPGEFTEVSSPGTPDNNITNLDAAALKNLPVLGPGDTLEDIGFFVTPKANAAEDFIDGTITFTAGAEPSDIGL